MQPGRSNRLMQMQAEGLAPSVPPGYLLFTRRADQRYLVLDFLQLANDYNHQALIRGLVYIRVSRPVATQMQTNHQR